MAKVIFMIMSLSVTNIFLSLLSENMKVENQIDVIYKDETIFVYVPKTYKASCYYDGDTRWCTTSKRSNADWEKYKQYSMFRFKFADGCKIRLTWGYRNFNWADVDNHELKNSDGSFLNDNPFEIDNSKTKGYDELQKRIDGIPEDAKKKIIDYHKTHMKKG
jgi:hypothetical protein